MPYKDIEQKRKNSREWKRNYAKTEAGIKKGRIDNWKRSGIVCENNWNEIYDWVISTTQCDICDCILTQSKRATLTRKCLDHDHTLKGEYNIRGVICHGCNVSHQSRKKQ